MTTFDTVLFFIGLAVLIYQLVLMVVMRCTAVVKGKPVNRKAVLLLLTILLVAVVLRTENLEQRWPIIVILALCCLTFSCSGIALSAKGMFFSGRFLPFRTSAYYRIEKKADKTVVLRLSRVFREGIMQITEDQLPKALELLTAAGVPEESEYNQKVDRHVENRKQGKAKRKAKKKK